MVKLEILKQYTSNKKFILTLNPDFEDIELVESIVPEDTPKKYNENFHLDGVDNSIILIYEKIKEVANSLSPNIVLNPQKYYISLKENRNFAYLDFKKKKIKIAVMVPYKKGREMIKHHRLRQFTEGIERFYGHPSFEVTVENQNNFDEIINVIEEAYKLQKKRLVSIIPTETSINDKNDWND